MESCWHTSSWEGGLLETNPERAEFLWDRKTGLMVFQNRKHKRNWSFWNMHETWILLTDKGICQTDRSIPICWLLSFSAVQWIFTSLQVLFFLLHLIIFSPATSHVIYFWHKGCPFWCWASDFFKKNFLWLAMECQQAAKRKQWLLGLGLLSKRSSEIGMYIKDKQLNGNN